MRPASISMKGYVPYAWQFKDENLFIPVQKHGKTNLFGLYSKTKPFEYQLADKNITANMVRE